VKKKKAAERISRDKRRIGGLSWYRKKTGILSGNEGLIRG